MKWWNFKISEVVQSNAEINKGHNAHYDKINFVKFDFYPFLIIIFLIFLAAGLSVCAALALKPGICL